MPTKTEILTQISNDWVDDANVKAICGRVLEYLVGDDQATIRYLGYEDLRIITGYEYEEELLLKSAKYLCASGLLVLGFEFIDELDDNSYFLEPQGLSEAKQDGYLTHPGNGRQKIYDFESYVFYFFSPTDLARAL